MGGSAGSASRRRTSASCLPARRRGAGGAPRRPPGRGRGTGQRQPRSSRTSGCRCTKRLCRSSSSRRSSGGSRASWCSARVAKRCCAAARSPRAQGAGSLLRTWRVSVAAGAARGGGTAPRRSRMTAADAGSEAEPAGARGHDDADARARAPAGRAEHGGRWRQLPTHQRVSVRGGMFARPRTRSGSSARRPRRECPELVEAAVPCGRAHCLAARASPDSFDSRGRVRPRACAH